MPSQAPSRPDLALPADADAAPAVNPRDTVAGLEKGLLVIEAFDVDKPRLTVSEVAQRADISRAAARRYLITLSQIGYAQFDGQHYALTPKVLRLGQSYMHSARMPRIIQPRLHKMAQALGESSSAGVLDHDDVIAVAASTMGRRVVSATLQPGTRVPAYCTANGRMLLACQPESGWDTWLERQRLLPLTSHTLTDPAALRLELARSKSRGYALVDQELEPGLRTLSVPLHNQRGDVMAAINVSVSASRVSLEELTERALPALLETQAELRPLL
jgi:IclR family pca regulon transcriptional regulator